MVYFAHGSVGGFENMTRARVGILRGGTSSEYDASLRTGAAMLASLPEERYETRDILIDKRGMWHLRGIPADPVRALSHVDVVLNALHGGVGEDGAVQRILERVGVPFVGSRAHAANLSLDKIRAREAFERSGVRIPRAFAFSLADGISTADMARRVFARFGPPYVVKPPREGGGAGVAFAESIIALPDVLGDVLDAYGGCLVEEFVIGREAVVALVEGFRGEDLYALPPARIELLGDARVFDKEARERGTARCLVPSDFSHAEKESLMEAARLAHRALGLSHFSRADIIVTPRGTPYLLEVNASPKLHEGAVLSNLLHAIGSSTQEFLEHAIRLANK